MEGEYALVSALDDPLPKVEPPEEDPLGGTVSPSEDLTVPPSQGTVTGIPVPTPETGPGTTPGVQIVNLNDLLHKPTQQVPTASPHDQESDSNTSKSLNITVPGGQVINIPLIQLQSAVDYASGREQITNITSTIIPPSCEEKYSSLSSSQFPDSIVEPKVIEYDTNELEIIKDEPEEVSVADPEEPHMDDKNKAVEPSIMNTMIPAQNTAPNSKKLGTDTSPVVKPISVPGGHLVPIPLDLLRGGSSNINISLTTAQSANPHQPVKPKTTDSLGQTVTTPSSASSGTINHPVAVSTSPGVPSLLPGANMVLVFTPDGRFVTRPITSTVASSLQNAVNTPSVSNSHKISMPVATTTSDSNSSSITVLKNQITAKMSNALKSTASNKTPTSTPTICVSHSHPSRQPNTNPVKNIPPLHWINKLDSKPTWPPPLSTKNKQQNPKSQLPLSGSWTNPNPPSKKSQLPLSGSWTNHNPPTVPPRDVTHNTDQSAALPQPERDPLEGPVQDIIRYPSQTKRNLGIDTIVRINSFGSIQREPPIAKRSKSTQCSVFHPKFISLREQASKTEPEEFKRPLMKPLSRGVGMGVQAKCVVYNVFKYFEQRKAFYKLIYTVSEVTATATGVTGTTVKRIMREAKKTCNKDDPDSMPTFKGPNMRRARVKIVISNIHIDTALRRYFHEHLLKKKVAPGLHYLRKKCLSDGLKVGSMSTNFIRLRTKKLGFITVRTTRRMITVEGPSIRTWRYNYLHQIKTCLEEKKNIVFTFAINLRQVKKSETVWEVLESCDGIAEESRVLTVLHAADENGFIDGGFFINDTVINPSIVTDKKWYHEWLELHVLRKIPEGSVVVLGYGKYHEMTDNEWKPSVGSSKREVIDWLKSHMIGDVDETQPKCVLLEKVCKIPVEQKYSIDSLVETYGHTPVHVPPSQKDLNPLEYIWEDIRAKLVQRRFKTVKDSMTKEFSSSEDKLKKAWEQVHKCEEAYRKNDPLLDDAQEAAIRKLGGLWTCPNNGPLPDETGEDLDVDLGSIDSDTSDSSSPGESESDSKSASGSNSDSDSDSESESSSESNESAGSTSEDSEDDVPLSERISGSKRRKIK